MQFFRHSGADLAWTSEGDGPAVLALHAGVADMRMWEPLVERLRDDVRLIRMDLRGFGETRHGAGSFTAASDAAAVLDAAGVDRATVVGNSLGGMVAEELAATAPERVSGLVLAAPAIGEWDWSEAVRAFGAAEQEALEHGDIDAAVEINLRMWVDSSEAAAPYRELVADMQRRAFELQLERELDESPLDLDLAAIDVPAVVLAGELDYADYRAIAAHVAERLPRGALVLVPGAGHLLPLEAPDAVADAVRTIACG